MEDQLIGYKRCGNFIVMMNITGDNNENREVFNSQRAKYRCSKALVIDILRLDRKSSGKTLVACTFDPKITYKKDRETFVRYSEGDEFSGIDYYKTFEGAFFASANPPADRHIGEYSGEWITCYDDGRIQTRGKYLRGLPIEKHYTLDTSGNIVELSEYYSNGILQRKGYFDDKGQKTGGWTRGERKITGFRTLKRS